MMRRISPLLVDRRLRRMLLATWCVGWVLVALMSLRPIDIGSGADKVMHFAGYALMAATAAGFCHSLRGLVACAALTSVAGLVFEGLQGLLPYRSAEPLDAFANATGAAVGCMVACVWVVLIVRRVHRARGSPA